MRERLTLIGGQLNVESDPEGVTVLATVPLTAMLLTPEPPEAEDGTS
jgi:signal transduction histidine kinase